MLRGDDLKSKLGNRAPMSARAVAVIRPAGTIIARLAFPYMLSGHERPVARFSVLTSRSVDKPDSSFSAA